MNAGLEVTLVLLLCLITANLPFINERLLLVGPRLQPKHWALRLLELVLWCAICVGLGFGLEAQIGQRHPQGWEFYAAMGSLYLTFAFPGFVWRYLRKRRPGEAA